MIFNVSVLSIPKRTMNTNLCQHCPNIMPTIIVTVGQRWANVILKIFLRWANVAPTCWANIGTLCTYNVGPTLKANVGPTKCRMLAQCWANVCVLSGYSVIICISLKFQGGFSRGDTGVRAPPPPPLPAVTPSMGINVHVCLFLFTNVFITFSRHFYHDGAQFWIECLFINITTVW